MARHRSPQGRRAHLGLPLPLSPAAAGAGALRSAPRTRPLPTRLVATAVAGGALAAAGQPALDRVAPHATDGLDVLRVAASALLARQGPPPGLPVAAPVAPLTVVAPAELPVAGAGDLVKAADLHRVAAETAAAEEARQAEEARRAALQVEAAAATTDGSVQMIVGRITSGFGARWGTSHQGLDVAAPIGTPIRVPLDGTVIDSGPASGFGRWVRVRHDDGTVTVYGHVSQSHVRVGESVSAGDVIADVGNEGRSTGPHLHFEVVTPGGTKINPRPWLDERGIGLT